MHALCYYCCSGEEKPPYDSIYSKIAHFAGSTVSIEFMSVDTDDYAYNRYFATMPWTSNGLNEYESNKKMRKFGIKGIPRLVLLNKCGLCVAYKKCR